MKDPSLNSLAPASKTSTWKRWSIAAIATVCTLGTTAISMTPLPVLAQSRLPQSAQERMLRTLTVTGQCTEKIPATLAQVQLGVEAQGKTAQQVQQEVAIANTPIMQNIPNATPVRLSAVLVLFTFSSSNVNLSELESIFSVFAMR